MHRDEILSDRIPPCGGVKVVDRDLTDASQLICQKWYTLVYRFEKQSTSVDRGEI